VVSSPFGGDIVKLRGSPKCSTTKPRQKCVGGQINYLGMVKRWRMTLVGEMDNPQPIPKAIHMAMDEVHRLNGNGLLVSVRLKFKL
jgi:hypothetical protein